MVKWKEQQQKSSLLYFETSQKTKIFGEQTAAARNEVTAKKLLADSFKTFSGRPEDWTVSGPCELYFKLIFEAIFNDVFTFIALPSTNKNIKKHGHVFPPQS